MRSPRGAPFPTPAPCRAPWSGLLLSPPSPDPSPVSIPRGLRRRGAALAPQTSSGFHAHKSVRPLHGLPTPRSLPHASPAHQKARFLQAGAMPPPPRSSPDIPVCPAQRQCPESCSSARRGFRTPVPSPGCCSGARESSRTPAPAPAPSAGGQRGLTSAQSQEEPQSHTRAPHGGRGLEPGWV